MTPNGDLSTGALIENPTTPTTMVAFLKRVQEVIWNRKFLSSNREGLFGLAPTKAEPGGLICILFGCSVPVILRKIIFGVDGGCYELVGEAYIHGMMEGQALPRPLPQYPYHDFESFEIR